MERQKNQGDICWIASGFLIASDVLASQRSRGSVNDRIQVAVMGMGGRGGELMSFSSKKGVEVVVLCDPDETRMRTWGTTLETAPNKQRLQHLPEPQGMHSLRSICQLALAVCLLLLPPAAADDGRAFDTRGGTALPPVAEMLAAKDWYFDRAVHPETHLIYARVNLDDPHRWKNTVFPKPDDIRNKVNNDSEIPNLSNCPYAGGIFLGQLVDIYSLTRDERCFPQAHVVFDGLKRLAEVSERKGFIARGVLPGDPTKAHFLNSSVDQYTLYVYGFYKYYFSPLAGEEEKAHIRRILAEISEMIERDGTILATNGIPTWVSDIEAIRADRSSRMLEVYLVSHAVTGDPHWRDVYLEKVREAQHRRLRTILDPQLIRFQYMPRDLKYGPDHVGWASLWQSQYSLVPLFELERDIPLKTAYLEAMRVHGQIAERYRGNGAELIIPMLAENRHCFSPVDSSPETLRRWEDLKRKTIEALTNAKRWRVEMPRSTRIGSELTHVGNSMMAEAEVFWTGWARGVFRPGQ